MSPPQARMGRVGYCSRIVRISQKASRSPESSRPIVTTMRVLRRNSRRLSRAWSAVPASAMTSMSGSLATNNLSPALTTAWASTNTTPTVGEVSIPLLLPKSQTGSPRVRNDSPAAPGKAIRERSITGLHRKMGIAGRTPLPEAVHRRHQPPYLSPLVRHPRRSNRRSYALLMTSRACKSELFGLGGRQYRDLSEVPQTGTSAETCLAGLLTVRERGQGLWEEKAHGQTNGRRSRESDDGAGPAVAPGAGTAPLPRWLFRVLVVGPRGLAYSLSHSGRHHGTFSQPCRY